MLKRSLLGTSLMSAFAMATLCLLSIVVTAQKGPQSTEGIPIRGGDVKLGKNPGGGLASARTIHIDSNGTADLGTPEQGSYWITIELSPTQKAALRTNGGSGVLLVKIEGAVGGTKHWAWDTEKSHEMTHVIQSSGGRAAWPPAGDGTDRITFDADGSHAVKVSIRIDGLH